MKSSGSSLSGNALVGMLWMGWAQGAYLFLQLAILAILARLITPAEFGVMSAALVVIALSKIFYQLGLGPAIVQRPRLEERHLKTAFSASLVFGLSLGALVWLSAPFVASFFQMGELRPVLRVLSLIFPLLGFGLVSQSQLQRELRFRWLANRDVLTFAFGYGVVGVLTARAGFGVWALVCAHIGHTVLNVVALLIVRPPKGVAVDWRAFKELMYFGGGHTLARLGNFLAHQGDNIVVGRWLGPQALGFYGRAYQLMATPASMFAGVLDKVLFPTMAKVQDDVRRLAAAYRRAVALVALVTLPAGVFLCALAPEVVRVVLGPQWDPVVPIVQIFACGLLFRTSYKISDSITRATGAVYRRAWRQGLYAALVVGGAWIGHHWGVIGVAVGVFGALAMNFFMMAQLSLQIARIPWPSFWRAHIPALKLAAISGAASVVTAMVLRGNGLPAIVVLAGSGSVTVLWTLLFVWLQPGPLLGADGLWMIGRLKLLWAGMVRRSSQAEVS